MSESLPQFGKKWFSGTHMQCSFCGQKTHENYCCPATPYVPPVRKRIPFVEKLLDNPRMRTNLFIDLEPHDVVEFVLTKGEEFNEGNPWEHSPMVYDGLRKRLGFWKAIGACNSVISWLGYGVPLRFVREPRHVAFQNHPSKPEHEVFVDGEVKKHTEDGCFVVAGRGSVLCSEPILVIEQNGKLRRADDKRYTNAFQAKSQFKMMSLKADVPTLVAPGDVQITRDLEKAYYKVPIAEEARPYQCFNWKGVFYMAMIMLFGTCLAPFYFTKICRPIVRLFGALKIPAVNFIDDWFWSQNPEKLVYVKKVVDTLFEALGWTFNNKDQEGTSVKFLGFIVDSMKRKFVVTPEKLLRISTQLRDMSKAGFNRTVVEHAQLTSLLGGVVSLALAIPSVRLWCRSLYRQAIAVTCECVLNEESMGEIDMLIFLLRFSNGAPFADPRHEVELWVDSGEIGWGMSVQDVEVRQHFVAGVIGSSSTHRELVGLLSGLYNSEVAVRIQGKVALLHMDSMCSVRNLLNGGGPDSWDSQRCETDLEAMSRTRHTVVS